MTTRMLGLSALLLLLGCSAHARITKLDPSNPLGATKVLALAPVDFIALHIDDEPLTVFLSEGGDDARQDLVEWMRIINEGFLEEFMKEARERGLDVRVDSREAHLILRANVTDIEPGTFMLSPGRLRMVLSVTARDGRIVDQIVLEFEKKGGFPRATAGGRLDTDARMIAQKAAMLLTKRASGPFRAPPPAPTRRLPAPMDRDEPPPPPEPDPPNAQPSPAPAKPKYTPKGI
jgi:hypothetical protein